MLIRDYAPFGEVAAQVLQIVLGIINDSGEFFRSGSSGQWRLWLTDEDVTRYDERIAALAPADFVDWLHHVST